MRLRYDQVQHNVDIGVGEQLVGVRMRARNPVAACLLNGPCRVTSCTTEYVHDWMLFHIIEINLADIADSHNSYVDAAHGVYRDCRRVNPALRTSSSPRNLFVPRQRFTQRKNQNCVAIPAKTPNCPCP